MAESFAGIRVEDIDLTEKLVHIDSELRPLAHSANAPGDYSLDPDFRLG